MPIRDTKAAEAPARGGSGKYAVLILVLLLATIGSGSLAYSYKVQLDMLKSNPQRAAQEETKQLVAAVGKLIVLPTDEEPTVATVADPSKLLDQPFFAKAKQGDRVLIYTNARKAILYDPVANKILEVAPVNIGNAQPTPEPAPQPETPEEQ